MKEKFNINQIPELKQAIIDLTDKEKNQLLIRLINKDQVLIEHLHFKLLENDFDLVKRYEDLKLEISDLLNMNSVLMKQVNVNQRAKFVMSLVRELSGRINHFVKVTKSAYYELLLRTFLFISSVELFIEQHTEFSVYAEKLRVYQVNKLKVMLRLFEKLHDDLKYDFSLEFFDAIQFACSNSLNQELIAANVDYLQFKLND